MARKKQDLDKLNETGKRKKSERRAKPESKKADAKASKPEETQERRKVQRRRQIDPTTCERDYNNDEIEFMHALDEYKRTSGRMFPTCSEILEVLQKLGYRKMEIGELENCQGEQPANEFESMEAVDESLESLEEVI